MMTHKLTIVNTLLIIADSRTPMLKRTEIDILNEKWWIEDSSSLGEIK